MLKFPKDLYSDVRVEDVAETTLVLEDGELKQCTESRRRGAFVRVYDGKRWYNSATTEPDRLQQELDTLAAMAEPNPAIGDDPVVRRFEVNRDCVLRWQAGDLRAVPVEQKLALLRSYQPLLERSGLAATRARYLDVHVDKTFRSSLGADIRQDYQHCGIALGYTVTGANAPFTNGRQRYASDFAGLQGCQEGLRAAIAEDVNYAMHAVPVEPGEYTCVLSPTVAGVFAHESFGHKSESDFMLGSETMRREWELGKQVGWEGLSILDSGVPNGSGYCPYDDEGTRARDTYLVKNGVLTGRLHSAATAAALDEAVTGNARAISFEFEPIVRMTSTWIAGGTDTFESLLRGAEGGLYIPDFFHGSGMSTFTIAPARAYRIRGGKPAEPVLVSVISGNVMQTLHQIDGATAETELRSLFTGGCGKMEQWPLRVAFGGPYLRVRGLKVQQTGTQAEYFAQMRLSRQTARDEAVELLQETIAYADGDAASSAKLEGIISDALAESQIESLIVAKGYQDCVAYISEDGISIAVAAPEDGLTQSDVALLSDIVLSQTSCKLSDIRVIGVEPEKGQ